MGRVFFPIPTLCAFEAARVFGRNEEMEEDVVVVHGREEKLSAADMRDSSI